MARIYILPTPSTSAYGPTTDKNKKKLTFEGKGTTVAQTIEISTQYGRRKNYTNPILGASVPCNTSTKKYNVFSEEPCPNPYFNKAADLPSNWATSGIEKSEYIDEQTLTEIKFNLIQNTLDTTLPDIRNMPTVRTKLMSLRLQFNEEGVTELDTSKLDDELTYLIFKQSSQSYNSLYAMSLQDYFTKNTNAKFYIADVEIEREARVRYERQQHKLSAMLDNMLDNFTDEKLYRFSTLLNIIQGKTTRAEIEIKLLDFVASSKLNESDKERFKKFYKMATEGNQADDFEREYIIKDCVSHRILTLSPDGVYWTSQKGSNRYEIAKTTERLNKYLKDPKNKEIYEMLKEELEAKK